MKRATACILASLSLWEPVFAQSYSLSSDGLAVYRLSGINAIPASSLTTPLPGGYSVSNGASGSVTSTGYTSGFVKKGFINSFFESGLGGSQFKAIYTNSTPLPPGAVLDWIQVVDTNSPRQGQTAPYLDNAGSQTQPFYPLTQSNRENSPDVFLLPQQQYFYDFSQRGPSRLNEIGDVSWKAQLYPVVVNGTSVEVENGLEWGWTMKKATVGVTSGTFAMPTPTGATTSGAGSSLFSWGTGNPSSLGFAATSFDTRPDEEFKVGTLTFYNGTIGNNTGATGVNLNLSFMFNNVPEKNLTVSTLLALVNTPNNSDARASSDTVALSEYGYTFDVLEGATSSVDLYGILSTGLTYTETRAEVDSSLFSGTLDVNPDYYFRLTGLKSPTAGGFINSVPEPETWLMMLIGFIGIGAILRKDKVCYSQLRYS